MRGTRKWELMQNSSSWQFAHDEISNDRLHTGNLRVMNIVSNYVSSMNYERLRDNVNKINLTEIVDNNRFSVKIPGYV